MQKSTKSQHIFNAKTLTRMEHSGVLSTHSLSAKGFPFGSVIPYMMTHHGDIILYASDIAQHSRNMTTNSKVSLCIYDGTQHDSQQNARVTLLGNAEVLGSTSRYSESYFDLFPQAKAYVEAHDFQFYKITPERIRYIGGFGEIYWFSQDEWKTKQPNWLIEIDHMIHHMHTDHLDALALMLNHQYGTNAKSGEVLMTSTFIEGFHCRYRANTYFIRYPEPCEEVIDVRKAMVNLTQLSRKNLRDERDECVA